MKKLIVLALIVCLGTAGVVSAEEKNLFKVYLEDRSPENFLKAFKEYEAQGKDTVNYDASVILSYLHLMELEKNLELLKENLGDLESGSKFQYANILLEMGRYDESIEIYDMLNSEIPDWSCPWRHKGEAHWKKGEFESAVLSLEKAIEKRETHYDAYVMLAEVLYDMKKYKRALNTLEKGLTYYGKDVEEPEREVKNLDVQFLYLDLLAKNGETQKYKQQLEKIRNVAPDDERLKSHTF